MTGLNHENGPIYSAGAALEQASGAMILIHGRGATAPSILSLAAEFQQPGLAFLAPQAAGNTWYPYPFMSPLEANEPALSSALRTIQHTLEQVRQAGIPDERIVLLGFSQGACLTLEFAARNARRYGSVIGLSGGLIGPDDTPRDYPGSLDGTPVFLGCSDVDFHIPVGRVHESAEVMSRLGGHVTKRIYPGMGHTVNEDEIAYVRDLLAALVTT
jgi:predicted esterase